MCFMEMFVGCWSVLLKRCCEWRLIVVFVGYRCYVKVDYEV